MDYKIPKYVKFVSEFPTTVTGKIQKYKMREMSAQEMQGKSGKNKAAQSKPETRNSKFETNSRKQ
jgi:fatty-acyl-CoA synthase